MNLLILVVLYHVSPEESETLSSLQKSIETLGKGHHRLLLRDNSEHPYSIDTLERLKMSLSPLNVHYWQDGENKSLSAIYNIVIRQYLSEQQHLVLLDHDSHFEEGFWKALFESHQAHPHCSLFLPIIKQGSDIISPSWVHGFKGSYWKKKQYGLVTTRHSTAINSGMVISGRYLKGGFEGYDENLRFYNTDNYFMWKYGQQYTHFCVIRYTLQHTLNFYDPAETFDKKAQRYREMRTSAIYLARLKSFWLALLMYLYYDVFSIKCAILNREIRFIFLR